MVLSSWHSDCRERVLPVHLMNIAWALGGRRPLDHADWLEAQIRLNCQPFVTVLVVLSLKAGADFTISRRVEGWDDLPRQFTCPQTVTHPGTNQAQHRVASMIKHNTLPLRHTTRPRMLSVFLVTFKRSLLCRQCYHVGSVFVQSCLNCCRFLRGASNSAWQAWTARGGIGHLCPYTSWQQNGRRVRFLSHIFLVLIFYNIWENDCLFWIHTVVLVCYFYVITASFFINDNDLHLKNGYIFISYLRF